jgi:serine/threonine-protein phosphatase 2B catalytic subunit
MPTAYPATPSMRRGSADSIGSSHPMEHLIRRTLEEDESESVVEKLAEKIARSRRVTGKQRSLKRHETT